MECPHWVWYTLDGSGMATVGVEWFRSVCLLIRMCGMSSVGMCVACPLWVWAVLRTFKIPNHENTKGEVVPVKAGRNGTRNWNFCTSRSPLLASCTSRYPLLASCTTRYPLLPSCTSRCPLLALLASCSLTDELELGRNRPVSIWRCMRQAWRCMRKTVGI